MASAIDYIAPYAVRLQERYGIPASVTIAQYILESGWQPSVLATRYNNPWGVKARPGEPAVWLPTTEYINGRRVTTLQPFRIYASIDEAVEDRARLLTSSRYTRYTASARTPYEYAQALERAGYATDPAYAEKLSSIIRQYGLTRYDQPGVFPVSADAGGGTVSQPDIDLTWKQSLLRFVVLVGLAVVAVYALFQLVPSPVESLAQEALKRLKQLPASKGGNKTKGGNKS